MKILFCFFAIVLFIIKENGFQAAGYSYESHSFQSHFHNKSVSHSHFRNSSNHRVFPTLTNANVHTASHSRNHTASSVSTSSHRDSYGNEIRKQSEKFVINEMEYRIYEVTNKTSAGVSVELSAEIFNGKFNNKTVVTDKDEVKRLQTDLHQKFHVQVHI